MTEAKAYEKLKKWLLEMDEAMTIAEKLFPQIVERNEKSVSGYCANSLADIAINNAPEYNENYGDPDEMQKSWEVMPKEIATLLVMIARYEMGVGDAYGGVHAFGKAKLEL